MFIMVQICNLLLFAILVLLLNMFCYHLYSYRGLPRKYICEQVAKKFEQNNWEQPNNFAFRRKFNRALDDYRIVIDYAIKSDDIDFELLDQVADRVFQIVTYRLFTPAN